MKATKAKIKRTKIIYMLFPMVIPMIVAMYQLLSGYRLGTKSDWLCQHSVFPDYFRNLFYKTGNIFPQFSAEIGGGQNIFNYAYYGLYNPLFLPSFFLPFVKMSTYTGVMMTIVWAADGILCYIWLQNHARDSVAIVSAVLLMLCAPIFYHTYVQIMFVDYMPFLILCFIFYDKHRPKAMAVSVLLMILTSFYYAVGGILALTLYIGSKFTLEEMKSPKSLIRLLWNRFYPIALGIGLSAFYLVPVLFTLKCGRENNTKYSWRELLIPSLNMKKYCYTPYGLGITLSILICVIAMILIGKKEDKKLTILTLCVIFIPVFCWALNGGLYIRSKDLIPLLPVIMYLFNGFLENVCGYQFGKIKILRYLVAPAIVCVTVLSSIMMNVANMNSLRSLCLMDDSLTKMENDVNAEEVSKLLSSDKALYRTEVKGSYEKANINRIFAIGQNITSSYSSIDNPDYHEFRTELGIAKQSRNYLTDDASHNPLFLRFMGVKYLIGDNGESGYSKVYEGGRNCIYKADSEIPMFYVTNQTISEADYENMSWQEKQLALMTASVTSKRNTQAEMSLHKLDVSLSEVSNETLKITKKGEEYSVICCEKTAVRIPVRVMESGYLFCSFQIENGTSHDLKIELDGEVNKLSAKSAGYYNGNTEFHFTRGISPDRTYLTIQFGKGEYKIRDIDFSLGKYDTERADALIQNPVVMKRDKSGDSFCGKYSCDSDGYFVTSIPYDKAFTIRVDHKMVKTECVNKAFLGAEIASGKHKIEISYIAKGSVAGRIISSVFLLSLLASVVKNGVCKKLSLDEVL